MLLRRPSWLAEFQSFVMRGNVVDLAVGIILGVAFTTIVASLVKDVINPLIGLIVGGIDFSNVFITLKGPKLPTVEAARAAGAVTLNVGLFLNAVIQFAIVGLAIFWMVKGLTLLRVRRDPAPPPATKTDLLLTEIRDLLAARSSDV